VDRCQLHPDVMDIEEEIDTIIQQTIRREASLSYPRVNDDSIYWLQFLGAFDSQSIYSCFSGLNVNIFGGSFSRAFR